MRDNWRSLVVRYPLLMLLLGVMMFGMAVMWGMVVLSMVVAMIAEIVLLIVKLFL